jgi:hypothetical protein
MGGGGTAPPFYKSDLDAVERLASEPQLLYSPGRDLTVSIG